MKRNFTAVLGMALAFSSGAVLAQGTQLPVPSNPTEQQEGNEPQSPIDVQRTTEGNTEGVNATADFGQLDANADGRLNRDEMRGSAGLTGNFKQMDSNSDGEVSEPEFAAFVSASPEGGSGSVRGKSDDPAQEGKSREEESREIDKDDIVPGEEDRD